MEIGTKPIPISVLTAVTNSALNAASVFPSRRIEISDFPYRFEPVGRYSNIQVMDAALQDFEVSRSCSDRAVPAGGLVRRSYHCRSSSTSAAAALYKLSRGCRLQ